MMADLWAWALAYPVIASVLGLILWLTTGMFVTVVFGLSRLPADTLDAAHGDDDEPEALNRPGTPPTTWGRSGSNWWPKL